MSEQWREKAIACIQSGEVDFEVMVELFGRDLTVDLFEAAGVVVPKEKRVE